MLGHVSSPRRISPRPNDAIMKSAWRRKSFATRVSRPLRISADCRGYRQPQSTVQFCPAGSAKVIYLQRCRQDTEPARDREEHDSQANGNTNGNDLYRSRVARRLVACTTLMFISLMIKSAIA